VEGAAKALIAAPICGFVGVAVTWVLKKVLLRRGTGLPPDAERGLSRSRGDPERASALGE
jgi:hypothetical protein